MITSQDHFEEMREAEQGIPMYNSAPNKDKIERVITLLNHDLMWATEERSKVIDPSDGTELAYFDGYIIAINLAKKRIKENL